MFQTTNQTFLYNKEPSSVISIWLVIFLVIFPMMFKNIPIPVSTNQTCSWFQLHESIPKLRRLVAVNIVQRLDRIPVSTLLVTAGAGQIGSTEFGWTVDC